MSHSQLTFVEPGNRIQLPADWVGALGLQKQVLLVQTNEGILVCPGPPTTWQEIFATKLTIRSAPPDEKEEAVEVTGDDFLF
jgi:hypothetical protein